MELPQTESASVNQAQTSHEQVPEREQGFRSEVLEPMEELLTLLETVTLAIKTPAEAEALKSEFPLFTKSINELKRALKNNDSDKATTPAGKKIVKAFGKVIAIAGKHEVSELDAKTINSACRTYVSKLNARLSEAGNSKKERFSFK